MICSEIAELAPLYHSRELDPERAGAFTAHLKTCPNCAGEIAQQRELDAHLCHALAGEAGESRALESRIRGQIAHERRSRRMLQAAVAAAMVLLAGGGLFYTVRGTQVPRLFADATRDHRREVVERQPRKWRTAPTEIQALAERQGLPAASVIALAPGRYHLDRGRLCRLDGRLFLHLVFSDGTREVSVFLRKPDRAAPAAEGEETTAAVGHEHLAALQTARVSGVCVAEDSGATLAVARAVAAVL